MSINRGRDIYDASERDYRTKCKKWIEEQLKPMVKESNPTQNSCASNRKKQTFEQMSSAAKKNEFERFEKNAEQNSSNNHDFFEPFLDYENCSKEEKNKVYTLKKQSQMSTNRKHNTQDVHEKSRPPVRSSEKRYPEKRSKVSDDGKLDFGEIENYPYYLDYSSVSQQHSKKRKMDEDHDISLNFGDVEKAFNDKRNGKDIGRQLRTKESERHRNSKSPLNLYRNDEPQQMGFKRVIERSYEELLDTPRFSIPNDLNIEPNKQSERRRYEKVSIRKTSSDDVERAMERYDSKKQHRDKLKHDSGVDKYKKEIDDFQIFKMKNPLHALQKVFDSHINSHPIIFNIKCQNLIIGTDSNNFERN